MVSTCSVSEWHLAMYLCNDQKGFCCLCICSSPFAQSFQLQTVWIMEWFDTLIDIKTPLQTAFFCHRKPCARNDVSNTLPKSGLISRIVTECWCCFAPRFATICALSIELFATELDGAQGATGGQKAYVYYISWNSCLFTVGLWQVCPSISNVLSALSVSEAGLRSNNAKPKVPSRSGFAWHWWFWWFQVNPGNRGNRDRAPAPIPGHRGNTAGRWGWSGWWAHKFTEHLHVQHVRFKEQMAHMASRGVQMGHLNWTSFRSHWNILELCVVCKAKV